MTRKTTTLSYRLEPNWQRRVREVMTNASVRRQGAFCPNVVIVAKGARARPHYEVFLDKVRQTFPEARWIEQPNASHMAVHCPAMGRKADRLELAKKTLVIGTHGNPVRRSTESGIVCPNYWHFSTTSFCCYDCVYCYLAGSCSTLASPAVKVYVNLEEIVGQLARQCGRLNRETGFYLGKLQDGLSLDFLTNYSKVLVPFFAEQRHGRFVFLTKSDDVANLLELDHGGHTVATWSLNAPAFAKRWEREAPSVRRRLRAARRCRDAGYPVRFIIMPMIPARGWKHEYAKLIDSIFATVVPERITLGSICSYPTARRLACARTEPDDELADLLSRERLERGPDGRLRFPMQTRAEMYRFVMDEIRSRDAGMPVGLCLEVLEVWKALGLFPGQPACNCVV